MHDSTKRRPLDGRAERTPLFRRFATPTAGRRLPAALPKPNLAARLDVAVTRGTANPVDADVCVIVMAVDADPDSLTAVRSVIDQPVRAEIVLVNTGTGSLMPLLPPEVLRRITLVESPGRRFAGGTRNLGIRHSRAPIVAFLAADCVAHPDWLRSRMAAHKSGFALVASSVIPTADEHGEIPSASWASYVLIHSHRAPRASQGPNSVLFGISYRRDILEQEGLFDETVRVSEDLEFNRRLREKGYHPLWDPKVVALHRYPTGLVGAMFDQFARGRRSAQYALSRSDVTLLRHFRATWRRSRQRVAAARLPRDDFDFGNPRAVMVMLHVLWWSHATGVLSAAIGGKRGSPA